MALRGPQRSAVVQALRGWIEKLSQDDPVAEYVLAHGTPFRSQELTDDEWKVVDHAAGRRHFLPKHCYLNVDRLVRMDAGDDLQYCEGYWYDIRTRDPLKAPGYAHHAWVTLNGKVIDPTLRHNRDTGHGKTRWRDRPVGIIPKEEAYFGVEVDSLTLARWRAGPAVGQTLTLLQAIVQGLVSTG